LGIIKALKGYERLCFTWSSLPCNFQRNCATKTSIMKQ